ncbi:hypothetical protein L6452_22408 [Arctium lappa]|uniref:Uncharacterized protein n=1 Tax=Arctium lappa TaxID=4217 RepID=A0ACB9B0D4_ARCLA|nr:hypothetical protein L6452_22408 [Arctium lappa]
MPAEATPPVSTTNPAVVLEPIAPQQSVTIPNKYVFPSLFPSEPEPKTTESRKDDAAIDLPHTDHVAASPPKIADIGTPTVQTASNPKSSEINPVPPYIPYP